ncbi:MAG: WhiB family transcriptional regulator [Nitriliruptorales bacterium]
MRNGLGRNGAGRNGAGAIGSANNGSGGAAALEPCPPVVGTQHRPGPEGTWEERAACRGADVDLFFSPNERDQQQALAYCAVCEVRQECLEAAIMNGETFGIWGGLLESDRRAYVRGIWYRRRSSAPALPGARLRHNGLAEGASAQRPS